jgi:hypothetical protein
VTGKQVFGRSKRVVFDSYGGRRTRRRLPRWLLLLLFGVFLGAAAVLVVQERYLPPRLSANESAQLRSAFDQADGERQRLRAELGETRQRLDMTLAKGNALAEELATSRAATVRLRDDVATVVASLPPDPRGGQVEVRAAQFVARGGVLSYDVVLMRDGSSTKPMPGTVRFVVTGESSRGTPDTVTLKPISLALGNHEVVRGTAPLPEGFRPQQATIQVLDRDAGKPLGMRVLRVK